jgi:uncharacterized membrane protein
MDTNQCVKEGRKLQMSDEKGDETEVNMIGIGMVFGISIGSGIGLIFDNVAAGLALGIAVGTMVGVVIETRSTEDRKTRD